MNKFFYKLFSLSVMLFLSDAASFAQFSGTINVGAGQTYTTLTASDGLFNAINSSSVTGDIIIQITSDILNLALLH